MTQDTLMTKSKDYFKFEELVDMVEQWADDRNILSNSTALFQSTKTLEEVIELQQALLKFVDTPLEPKVFDDARSEVEDAYGDILVTLIVGMAIEGFHPTNALQKAYDVISKRSGRIVNGLFVKDK